MRSVFFFEDFPWFLETVIARGITLH